MLYSRGQKDYILMQKILRVHKTKRVSPELQTDVPATIFYSEFPFIGLQRYFTWTTKLSAVFSIRKMEIN